MKTAVKNLIVLTADPTMQKVVSALLNERQASLGIANIDSDVIAHPLRESGVVKGAADFLRSSLKLYRRALVMCDYHGSHVQMARGELESKLETDLSRNGWEERCAAVVIDPELEVWVWQRSTHVESALGWQGKDPQIWRWLIQQNLWDYLVSEKPADPKLCMKAALKEVEMKWSSAIHVEIAKNASLHGCTDASFVKFRDTLRLWFPLSKKDR